MKVPSKVLNTVVKLTKENVTLPEGVTREEMDFLRKWAEEGITKRSQPRQEEAKDE